MTIHKHKFKPSPIPNYEVCTICETLHRVSDVAPSSVYADGYWSREGHSNIHEQVYNVSQFKSEDGETKIEAVLKYAPDPYLPSNSDGLVIEVACAPGTMLRELSKRYNMVYGVEYSDQYRDELVTESGMSDHWFRFGPFPDSTKKLPSGEFIYFCALDFLEHIEDGQAVMDETKRLLADGGTAVFMSPFLYDDGQYRECDRHPEHIWLYSQKYLKEWMESMFSEVKFDRWVVGHEILIVKK